MMRLKDTKNAAFAVSSNLEENEEFSPEYGESLVEGDIRPFIIKNYKNNGACEALLCD